MNFKREVQQKISFHFINKNITFVFHTAHTYNTSVVHIFSMLVFRAISEELSVLSHLSCPSLWLPLAALESS